MTAELPLAPEEAPKLDTGGQADIVSELIAAYEELVASGEINPD